MAARTSAVILALIAKAEANLEKLRAELAEAPQAYLPEVGEFVTVRYGRADKARDYSGTVLKITDGRPGYPKNVSVLIENADGLPEVVTVYDLNVSKPALPELEELASTTGEDVYAG